jgi:hypothetical protein
MMLLQSVTRKTLDSARVAGQLSHLLGGMLLNMAAAVADLTEHGVLVIRPSSLNTWDDCQARTFAKSYPHLMIAKGYELREIPRHIGAVVGTSVHAAAEHMQRARLTTGERGKLDDAVEFAITRMREEMDLGEVAWDYDTPRVNEAQTQIQRMAYAYKRDVADEISVVALEERLVANFSENVVISGQMDVVSILPGRLRDIKTGKRRSYCLPQLGSYSSLGRAHGHSIDDIVEDYVKRVPVAKEQPPVETIPLDRIIAEAVARRTILSMDAAVRKFQETGDRHAFTRNPNSGLCSDRFCPLWGTKGCPEGAMK